MELVSNHVKIAHFGNNSAVPLGTAASQFH